MSFGFLKEGLPFASFDQGPNDSAVLHKLPKETNVVPKMDIILTFLAMGALFNDEGGKNDP